MKFRNKTISIFEIALFLLTVLFIFSCNHSENEGSDAPPQHTFDIPEGYMDEAVEIPAFWLSTIEEIDTFIENNVKKGQVEVVGTSAGGRPIISVAYGEKRQGEGTTTFSGALSVSDIASYRGADSDKRVYMGIAGVHGFELEGIVGVLNMIAVFETGKDLRGQEQPELFAMLDSVDRIVLIPLISPDGRARVPIRMETNKGGEPDAFTVHEYLNTGGKKDGSIIGWPDVKEHIPMDFADFGFPGGYPNDAGVNIMHDDFFGSPQPETKMLLDILSAEKPDLIINMHTGVPTNNYYMQIHRPFMEPKLQPVFDGLYRKIKTGLTENGLQGSNDVSVESTPPDRMSGYNLNTALNLHSGALCVVIESPSHGYYGTNLAGDPAQQTPEMLLDAQLIAHRKALAFLVENGGRGKWEEKLSKTKE